MKKSQISEMPQYYDRYINLIPDIELTDALDQSMKDLKLLDKNRLEKLNDKRYAPGKWSVKDIFQHLIDTERIFNYRILLFAREDETAAPGFDQDTYVIKATAERRTVSDLINELETVRAATKSLFKSFDTEILLRKGKSWEYESSVLALGFTILGHQSHHLNVIKEKYFPLCAEVK